MRSLPHPNVALQCPKPSYSLSVRPRGGRRPAPDPLLPHPGEQSSEGPPAPDQPPPRKPRTQPAATLTAATAAEEPLLVPRKYSFSPEAASPSREHFRVKPLGPEKAWGR